VVSGGISVSPGSGTSALTGAGTLFTFSAPPVAPQPGCAFPYTWSFGDGGNDSGQTATHIYAKKGSSATKSYTVSLAISTFQVPETWTGTIQVVVNP
jgi:hypothetical protein